jgi:pyridoxamine 5'-phosphate oxidase
MTRMEIQGGNVSDMVDTDAAVGISITDNPLYQKLGLLLPGTNAPALTQYNSANAMALSTVDADGLPDVRMVLLKGVDADGFVFYTNYNSRKGQDLAVQPWACLNFFWQPLERQVRLNGLIAKVSAQESDDYFHSRPLGSRLGAWVSAQSQPTTLAALEANTAAVQQKYGDQPPRPPHWGGYRLAPEYFEFWQGRPSRLHDRLTYQRSGTSWALERISP